MTRIVAWCLGFMKWVSDDPSYVTGGEPKYPQELFSAVDLLSLQFLVLVFYSAGGGSSEITCIATVGSLVLQGGGVAAVKSAVSCRMASKVMAGVSDVDLRKKMEKDSLLLRLVIVLQGTKKYGDQNSSDGGNYLEMEEITVVILVRDRCPRGKDNLPRLPIRTNIVRLATPSIGVETSFIGLKCWLGFFLLPEADKEGKETPSGRLSVTWRKGQELLNKQLKDSLEGSSEVVCTWVKVQKRSKWRQC
ncbi:hypothetical protein Tco_1541422 [Tanacetum coccineum]